MMQPRARSSAASFAAVIRVATLGAVALTSSFDLGVQLERLRLRRKGEM